MFCCTCFNSVRFKSDVSYNEAYAIKGYSAESSQGIKRYFFNLVCESVYIWILS